MKHCDECAKDYAYHNMLVKMTGLLCPKCRAILVPIRDPEFMRELNRRKFKERRR